MKFYYEPVNINQWNMFEMVKSKGHVEHFLATKDMQIGDVIFLHVGSQNKNYESGVYAIGKVISKPYILTNSPKEYCDNKNTVDVEIIKITYDTPFLTHMECKKYITQFRTVHKLNDEKGKALYKIVK